MPDIRILLTILLILIIAGVIWNYPQSITPDCPHRIIPSEDQCRLFLGDAPVTEMYATYQFCEYGTDEIWHYNKTKAIEQEKEKGMCLP